MGKGGVGKETGFPEEFYSAGGQELTGAEIGPLEVREAGPACPDTQSCFPRVTSSGDGMGLRTGPRMEQCCFVTVTSLSPFPHISPPDWVKLCA